jgi:DNA-binding protein YbaB
VLDSWAAELAAAKFSGTGPDRLAQAVVDGTGKLVSLNLDPGIMRRSVGALTKEVVAAVSRAQEAARAKGTEQATRLEELAQQASAEAEEYRHQAERQLGELNTLVNDLIRHRERA